MSRARARLTENPFFVLDVAPEADRAEVERAAAKWLGMLELGLADAATYRSPLGTHARTPEAVRAAAATLRDPARRLIAEVWARVPTAASPPEATAPPPSVSPWNDAPAALGFAPRGGKT